MTLYEFIVTISAMGLFGLVYFMIYRDLKKQIKKLEQELDEEQDRNNKNEE